MPRRDNYDFAEELRKAAAEVKDQAAQEDGTAAGILAEEPVPLSVFVQDKKFLGNPPLSPVQYDAVRHIERIYYPTMYPLLSAEFESGKREGRLHIASSDAVWREERYWSQPVRMTNFVTLQWGKGCISENSDIYDSRSGQWRRVGSIVDSVTVQGVPAVNLSGTTEHLPGEPALVSGSDRTWAPTEGAPFKRGRGECVRVTTTSGGQIDVYVGHLFISWENHNLPYRDRYRRAKPVWAPAGALAVGDRLAMMSKLDCLEPVVQDPREVELVGYWIGDGSMPVEGSHQWAFYIDLDPAADDLRQRYVDLVESYDGVSAKRETMASGTMRIRATMSGSGRKIETPLIDIIRKYGLYGSRAWDKKVPAEFFSLPDDQIATFLSALWDTDGSLYFTSHGSPRAQYVTVSEDLARGIQRLLLRLGVVSRLSCSVKSYVYKGEKRQGRPSWHLDVQADKYLKRLLSVMRLHGEKEKRRIQALEFTAVKQQQVLDGDVFWDTVKSIEPLGEQDYWDMTVPGQGTYVAGTSGFINSNSGKDHICRVASMRIAYLLLCLDSPQIYYGMPEQDTIHLLNVASNSAQAQQAFFMPIVRAVKKGWFADKCTARQNLISYAKNIESVSGHSDAESQEGLNLLLGVADEIDAFRAKGEMTFRRGASAREPTKSAESILNMIRTSSSTRFPEVFKNVRISFPRYLGSTIQRLTNEARADFEERGQKSRHYVSGPLATWEVNPRVPGREAFAEDYRDDPIMARAKYECRPDRAINPYFRNVAAVDASFRIVDQEPLAVSYSLEANAAGGREVWIPKYGFGKDLQPIRGAIYTLHADLAVSGDRAGVCMAHVQDYEEYESMTEDEDGAPYVVRESRPKVKVDFCIAYSADTSTSPPREIQIRWARQLCFELIRRGFNIKLFTFDSFQSVDSMQILENKGIETSKLSTNLSEEPWRNLRDLMYEGRISIPRLTIQGMAANQQRFLLREELLALSRLPNGKVDHPSDGCFVGETRIPLLDGSLPEIKDLVGKQVWVYSARPDGTIVPGLARGRRTKSACKLVDIVLDSGYVARCTPNHLWMLCDGTYKAAKNLVPGVDRLMPINRVWPINGGYERVTDAHGTRSQTHVLVAEHAAGRKVIAGEVVHHLNHVKTDNSPDNLAIVNHAEHRRLHANERWARDPEYVAKVRAGHAAWRETPGAAAALAARDFSSFSTPERRVMLREINRRVNPAFRHDITFESLKSALEEPNANAAARRLGCGRNVVISRLREFGYENWDDFRVACDSNHKVRYVIPVGLDTSVPVYDLEVDEWDNFALSGGVFVHNSKDLADALACAAVNAVVVGGREEGPNARTYFEPATFSVSEKFELPFGVTHGELRRMWQTNTTLPF